MEEPATSSCAKPEFRALIEKKSKWQVDQFLFGRANNERPTLQVKRFIEGIISADYHGRTMIELIQNAHDAHDKGSDDGQIHVLFDETEGAFGTLYVANSGRPLTETNFAAMVDVAVSDKPPSEGIGNKGVGFKSVLQFSDCPEVYSAADDSREFDGFTFRFGRHDDFAELAARWVPDEPDIAVEMESNISTLTLTFPLEAAPHRVDELGAAGYCTVIRLPLKSERARADVRDELLGVAGSTAPMHLFLDRIETVHLVVIESDRQPEGANDDRESWFPAPLDAEKRRSLALTRLPDEIDLSRRVSFALLQDQSEFIIARRTVPETAVLEAIAATREDGAHLPGWDEWQGDADVVLALAGGEPLSVPRLYNFLPMGDQVACPLPAYLQAPFFSSLDRRSLHDAYPINDLFLNEAAELAAELLIASTDGDLDIPAGTMVDLACWSKEHLPRLVSALDRRGRNLASMAFLPSLGEQSTRVSISEASLWETSGRFFSPARLKPEQRRSLLDPALGDARLSRLERLYLSLGFAGSWRPTDANLVEFAEACADHLQSSTAGPAAWADFYDELATAIPRHAPVAGALIVLGKEGLLHANGLPDQPTVFFPPQRSSTDSRMQPPSAVAARLAYVRDDIPWRLEDQTHRVGRDWLANWVEDFGSEEILKLVAEVTNGPGIGDAGLTESLLYALDVWRNARSPLGEESFPTKPFRVPTVGGWISADSAYFGRGWDGDDSWIDQGLVRLVEAVGDTSELDGIADKIISPPSTWLAPGHHEGMREFLERAGVQHGLWPVDVTPATWRITGSAINHPETLPDWSVSSWLQGPMPKAWLRTASGSEWRQPADYATRQYTLTRISRLPGQLDWDSFSPRAQEIYGELVLAGLDRWDDDDLKATFFRAESRSTATWPSFVTVFLMTASWLPQTIPGDRSTVTLKQAQHGWWVDGYVPDYLPAPAPHLRRAIGPTAITRLRRVGVRHWDGPGSAAARINHLAEIINAEGTWIRGTRAEYERSWADYLSNPTPQSPDGVLVETVGSVELADPSETGELIYFPVPDEPKSILLSQLPLTRLGFTDRALAKRVGEHLARTWPQRLRSVADAELQVHWTGPSQQGPLLDLVGDWLEKLVLLVLAHQQGVAGRRPRQLEQAASQLRSARLLVVDAFSTSVDGHEVEDTLRQTSCWVVGDDGQGLVLVREGHGRTRLRLAEQAAEGISQAVQAPSAFKDLRLALIDLQEVVRGPSPTNDDLALALRLPAAEVDLVSGEREAWRPDTSALVAVLATVAPDAAEELRGTDDIPDGREALQSWLASRLDNAPIEADAVLAYADRSWTTGPIEDGHVALSKANEGLRLLGLQSVQNTGAHIRDFTAFVANRREDIVDDLRDRFAGRAAHDPLAVPAYASLLDLPNLTADPAWSDTHWRVPEEAMSERVQEWLRAAAGPPAERTLPSVYELRSAQRQRVTNTLTTARDSALTWCELNQVDAPPTMDVASVSAQLRSSGYLDFAERTPKELLTWLHARGLWPDPMPLTLNQKKLGITQEDVRRARDRKRREQEEAKRRESAITYAGQTFTTDPDDLLRLDEMIATAAADVDLGNAPSFESLAEMAPIEPLRSGIGGQGSGRRKGIRAPHVPPEKTQNIGLAGELFASHWIRSNFGLAREETWRSGYRNDILGDGLGDDSLGYDFKVLAGETTHLIEVKVTTGDDTAFSLPESEIRRALDLAPHERYSILFITHVLNDESRRFHWLPNPFGPDARLFRVDGRQMLFRFDVSADPDQHLR